MVESQSSELIGPENYGVWSRSMRLALLVKNKLGFVDGTCAKSSYKGDLAVRWERCDAVILSWISAAVAPELMTSIVYASSSKKIWNDFKERFDKSSLTRIFHLWKKISILSQRTDSVTAYYSKMRDLWDEMDVTVPSPSCDCVESSSHVEHVKQQRLLQFLVGLNENYAQVRSSILLSPSVPSVNQAYAMAIQEESQRKLGQSEGGKEPLTMMAGRGAQPHNFNNQINNNFPAKKTQGFPADFKSKRKGSGSLNEAYANNSTSEASGSGSAYANNSISEASGSGSASKFYFQGGYFTKEKYKQVTKMLPPSSPTGTCRADANVAAGMNPLPDNVGGNTALFIGEVIGIGKENDGLYILRQEVLSTVGAVLKSKNSEEHKLWHLRLGHPSLKVLQHLPMLQNKLVEAVHEDCMVSPLEK
ncbi:hypothetical protein KY289_032067 [Solanum tuberosum]|nr:hypothetical protein KY289_032067 [Solanum tuberosum]